MVELGGTCVKCRKKTEFRDCHEVRMANGRWRVEAICAECGKKVSCFVKKPATAAEQAKQSAEHNKKDE